MSLRNHDGKITGGDLLQLGLVQADSEGSLTGLGGSQPFVGTTDPTTSLATGTAYIWFQMDSSGTLIDIIAGVA